MQSKTIDLISALKLLQTAAENIVQLRRSFDAALNKTSAIASTVHRVCQASFQTKEQRKQKPTSMKYPKK